MISLFLRQCLSVLQPLLLQIFLEIDLFMTLTVCPVDLQSISQFFKRSLLGMFLSSFILKFFVKSSKVVICLERIYSFLCFVLLITIFCFCDYLFPILSDFLNV